MCSLKSTDTLGLVKSLVCQILKWQFCSFNLPLPNATEKKYKIRTHKTTKEEIQRIKTSIMLNLSRNKWKWRLCWDLCIDFGKVYVKLLCIFNLFQFTTLSALLECFVLSERFKIILTCQQMENYTFPF